MKALDITDLDETEWVSKILVMWEWLLDTYNLFASMSVSIYIDIRKHMRRA